MNANETTGDAINDLGNALDKSAGIDRDLDGTAKPYREMVPDKPLSLVLSEARRLASKYNLPSFVYQTGVDSRGDATFNFCFLRENPEIGVLVARFAPDGR